jgi:hypothetical protein
MQTLINSSVEDTATASDLHNEVSMCEYCQHALTLGLDTDTGQNYLTCKDCDVNMEFDC